MKERMTGFQAHGTGADFFTDTAHSCRVQFVAPQVLRVKYCFAPAVAPLFSYGVIAGVEPNTNPALQDEYREAPAPAFSVEETDQAVVLTGAELRVEVAKEPFAIAVYDAQGVLVHQDLAEKSYLQDKNLRHSHYFQLGRYREFYGLGEKAGRLNKFNQRLRMYSCDTMGYDSEKTDPLYKHIPFFIKRDPESRRCCGIFYDMPQQGVIDLGCERSGYWPRYGYACFDGGDIDYYVMAGPSMQQVIRRYTALTGTTAMPTYASLGYMASTMYFTEQDRNCDAMILDFVEELGRQELGCDGFHLSSGYTTQEGKRCVFCWNDQRFPDPEGFFARMHRQGIPVSPNIKPALLTSHTLYEEFKREKAFFVDETTGEPYLERYWGGFASFVDFSSEGGRRMWKKYLTRSLLDKGCTAIWDDNNEYEISSEQAVCAGEGTPRAAYTLKPIFANMMAKTGREAIAEKDPALRPYVLSRAGYAGIQRYAQTWAGDNYTSWNDLKFNIPVMLGMGLSGVANQGCDVGGFQGPAPDGELFVRWVENGIFQPRFCIHSCNTDNTVTQPWSYGPDCTRAVRQAFRLRYAMGLYLYSCLRQSYLHGDPVMRALVYAFENDPKACAQDFDFLFGPWLLVANVLEPGAVEREVYLPAGCDWYDWHTHRRYAGGQTVRVPAPLGQIPMFYRSGTILPLLEPGQRMDMQATRKVQLLVEANEASEFALYQDDGKTQAYREGAYRQTTVRTKVEPAGVEIGFAMEGQGETYTREYEIRLIHGDSAPIRVLQDHTLLPVFLNERDYRQAETGWYYDLLTRHTFIRVRNPGVDFAVTVDYAIHDLVAM